MKLKLHGNQQQVDRLSEVKRVTDADTINLDVFARIPTNPSWVEKVVNVSYAYDRDTVSYTTGQEVMKPGVVYQLGAACHRGMKDLSESTTFFVGVACFQDTDKGRLPYLLALFEEDSPFAEVTKDVTFVVRDDAVFFVFRNMNIPFRPLVNLMIWTRCFTQFMAERVLSQPRFKDYTMLEKLAIAPFIYAVGDLPKLNTVSGDMPVYWSVGNRAIPETRHLFYHPFDFVNRNVNKDPAAGMDKRAGKVEAQPCNHFLSIRTDPLFDSSTFSVYFPTAEDTQKRGAWLRWPTTGNKMYGLTFEDAMLRCIRENKTIEELAKEKKGKE